VSYQTLVARFFRTVDPARRGGQFCDRGSQYRSAIFVANPGQRRVAEGTKARAAALLKKPVATEILPAARFYPAEGYHQDYYKKMPPNINTTAGAAAATPAWRRSGGNRPRVRTRRMPLKIAPSGRCLPICAPQPAAGLLMKFGGAAFPPRAEAGGRRPRAIRQNMLNGSVTNAFNESLTRWVLTRSPLAALCTDEEQGR
jgi:hypothetical protein